MKRFSIVLLSLLLVLCLIPAAAFAGPAYPLVIEGAKVNVEAKAGNTVTVPLTVSSNDGFIYGQLKIEWDNTLLKLTKVNYGFMADNASAAITGTESVYYPSFGNPNAAADVTSTGELLSLEFEVLTSSVTSTVINVSKSENGIYNYNIQEVIPQITNPVVNLTAPPQFVLKPGDVNGDGEVDANDLTALSRHIAQIETLTDATLLKNADVTGDNKVNADDLVLLARYVSKIINSFEQ